MGRVALFGYGELGVAGLEALASAGADIAVVVVPGNRSGVEVDRLRAAAAGRGLPVLVQPPRHAVLPFVDAIRSMKLDVIVVWSYSIILPAGVLLVPRHGAVNVHGGLLPEYRGGHVMQWALINGAREFGVTLHYMDEGVDTGPIIDERRFPVEDTDDARAVRAKIRSEGAELLRLWWPRLADGTAPHAPQDASRARYWRMRTPEDGRIDWSMDAEAICRLVRALSCNSPGAFADVAGRQLSVRCAHARPREAAVALPGQVTAADSSGVRVAAAAGDVVITAAEIDGRPIDLPELAELLAHVVPVSVAIASTRS